MNKLFANVTQAVVRLKFPHFTRENTARPLRYALFGLRWGALALLLALTVVRLNLIAPDALPLSVQRPLSKMGAALARTPGVASVLGVATGANEQKEALLRQQREADLAYWQEIADAHPKYPDAHLMVAAIAYELGDDDRARMAASRALALDPNSGEAMRLWELLEKTNN